MNKNLKILINGIIKDNPIFVLLLGMCPTLATTSSAINGMSMGLATMFVLICSNLVISLLKNLIPDMVRIPAYIVVIATFVTIIEMVMNAYVPALADSLGIFIPLIVVNCIVLGRAEAFASKNGMFASIFDGIGIGLGFTLSLTLLGATRELMGTGKIFSINIYPEQFGSLIFVLAPGLHCISVTSLQFSISFNTNNYGIYRNYHRCHICQQRCFLPVLGYLSLLGSFQKSRYRNWYGVGCDVCVDHCHHRHIPSSKRYFGTIWIGILADHHFHFGYCLFSADGGDRPKKDISRPLSSIGCIPSTYHHQLCDIGCGHTRNPERL